MVPRFVLAAIFNRSRTPFTRFAACGLIGALLGVGIIVTHNDPEFKIEWWQASLGGAIFGYVSAVLAWLFDILRDQSRSRLTHISACVGLVVGGIGFAVVAVVIFDIFASKTH